MSKPENWKAFTDRSASSLGSIKSQAYFSFYWKGIGGRTDLRSLREELHKAQHQLNEARSEFHRAKDGMTGRDKTEAYKYIQEIQAKINEAWSEYRDLSTLARQERQARLQGAISRCEVRLSKMYDALSRTEINLKNLYDRLRTTRNQEKVRQIEGWIREAEARMADIRSSIHGEELKLRDMQNKVDPG